MKVAAISYRVPSRVMTNSDMIEMLDRQNPQASKVRKAVFFRTIDTLFGRLGAKTRHVRDIAAGEKAADVILGAMDDALARAGMVPEDIDLLIYCGVGRGFLEPANAYFYARARGMRTTNCFDVTDACMSWVRAMQIAHLMLRSGAFRNAMIINGEFHLGLHDKWDIETLDSLSYTFPMRSPSAKLRRQRSCCRVIGNGASTIRHKLISRISARFRYRATPNSSLHPTVSG